MISRSPPNSKDTYPTNEGTSWQDLSVAKLVSEYQERNTNAAFGELVRRYQDRLFGVLVGIVGEHGLAEELCQCSFIKAAMRLHQLKDPHAFYAWLIAIAKSTASDELRKLQKQQFGHKQLLLHHPQRDTQTSDNFELHQTVYAVLSQLEPNDRLIVLLADLQQFSIKELSIALEIKESAVKMRVKRARERFRKLFREHT